MRTLRHLAAGVVYAIASTALTFIASLIDADAPTYVLTEVDD